MSITAAQVLEALKNVEDPDLKKDLVTLGMIKDLVVDGKNVNFTYLQDTDDLLEYEYVNGLPSLSSKLKKQVSYF